MIQLIDLILVFFLGHVQLTLQLSTDDFNMCIVLLSKFLHISLVSLTLSMEIQVCAGLFQ